MRCEEHGTMKCDAADVRKIPGMVAGLISDQFICNLATDWLELTAENARLREALEKLISEWPAHIIEIARAALGDK